MTMIARPTTVNNRSSPRMKNALIFILEQENVAINYEISMNSMGMKIVLLRIPHRFTGRPAPLRPFRIAPNCAHVPRAGTRFSPLLINKMYLSPRFYAPIPPGTASAQMLNSTHSTGTPHPTQTP